MSMEASIYNNKVVVNVSTNATGQTISKYEVYVNNVLEKTITTNKTIPSCLGAIAVLG